MGSIDIEWHNLALGCLIIIIPLVILLYYRTGLVKATLIAFFRMALQLFLVGLYLNYIFELNAYWLNLLWVLVMMIAASFTIVSRSELSIRHFTIPVLAGVVANVLINGAIVAWIVVGTDYFFDARYLIPIAGMMIGNSMSSTIVGTRYFYQTLAKEEEAFRFSLMCGASRNEALFPYISEAMKSAFSPTIANTASIGLIWLPGMMTGQILGGSDPSTAIKYQIMIIVAIFTGTVITLFVSLAISKKFAIDEFGLMNKLVR